MKINPKKTKIMVFQKRARKNADFHFLIDSQISVEEYTYWQSIVNGVQQYTYLETRMSSSGNFSVTREHLKEKAPDALFSLRRHMNLRKLKAAFACKIFDTMISPILTYNSEISVFMPNQILRPGTAQKSRRHTFNFVNDTWS